MRQNLDDEQREWLAFCLDYNAAVLKMDYHTMAWCRECQAIGHPYHDGLHWGL
jgi:hypothetical protein